ncbi:uncharacterized protein LOC144904657 [Branchiostoma floridae x Branchiostoma belcheri]
MSRYPLKIPCPVSGCSGKGTSGWVCSVDEDDMYIDEDGYLSCESYSHYAKIVNWRFDCGARGSGSKHNYQRYQSADLEGFTHALAIAMGTLNAAGADWVKTLVQSIYDQYTK